MEKSTYIQVVQIIGVVVGLFTPIVGYFTIRIIKSRDEEIKRLNEICGHIREDIIPEIRERLSQLDEAIRWLKG